MVNINLLPWRKQEQAYQQKIIKVICCGSIVLLAVLIGLPHFMMNYGVGVLEERVNELKASLAEIEEVRTIQQEKQAVDSEEENQKTTLSLREIILFILSLNKNEDSGVCFLSMAKRKNTVIFTGLTPSVSDLSTFLNEWRATNHFSQIKIEQLQQKENHRIQFRLRAIGNK
jgi:Tfp pilus assembly protein PilN